MTCRERWYELWRRKHDWQPVDRIEPLKHLTVHTLRCSRCPEYRQTVDNCPR